MIELDSGLRRATFAGYAGRLASHGTLVCCTLPALLVAVGAGAVLASAVTAFPALVWLSEYKEAVFGGAGFMLVVAGVMQWRARALPCPADRALARGCARTRRVVLTVYLISIAVFGLGALFAFVLPLVLG